MSIYKTYTPEQIEELLSNFLIDSWSYSKVQTFARHQCAFAMENIYGLKGKRSPASIAGNGYHTSLDYFFSQYKEGVLIELPQLEQAAFEAIGSVPANQWKLGKTTPTMEEAVQDALKDASKLLLNFYGEKGIYLDELEAIEGVELYFNEWLTVSGFDIPLPCHGKIDLVIRLKDGRRIIIDHKTKGSYTDEKEAALVTGTQAITYTLGFEAMYPEKKVDEVWFIENKASKNTKGGAQLQDIPIKMTTDNRKLFELLLYENLREMINAVQDPDHVYTINPADKFVDMAEVFDFWTRTQICEVEDFNVSDDKKELVAKRLRKIRNSNSEMINPEIIKKFREKAATFIKYDLSMTNMTQQEKIEHTLKTFGKMARVAHTFEGYSSNTFLLEVGAGVKVTDIFRYRMDIANALDVPAIRFGKDLKVYEGKSYVSIEFAKRRENTLVYNSADRKGFKIPMGRDNYDNVIYWDLDNQSTPHMLVGGATGSGKSVFLDATIEYAIEAGVPDIIILDPKYEFTHLAGPGIDVFNDIMEIEEVMAKLVKQMNDRVYKKIDRKCLVVFDEYADAIGRARKPQQLKTYEMVQVGEYANGSLKYQRQCTGSDASMTENLAMLLQKGRSSGFRIVCAAQRPSTEIIPGDAKANFPVRVAFRLNKRVDSEVVLDEPGAEDLTEKGDGLIITPEYRETIRFQSYYKEKKGVPA